MLFERTRDAACRDSTAPMVQKNCICSLADPVPFLSHLDAVIPQRFERHIADGHDALFGAFAHDSDDPKLKVNIAPVETHEFTHTNAGGIQELQDGTIADV